MAFRLPSFLRSHSHSRSGRIYGPGERFGRRFRVLRAMRGSQGIVYLLRNEEPEGPFDPQYLCAKTFSLEYLDTESARQRFFAEAEAWIRLGRYEHVVWAFDYEEVEGHPYLYIQFADGGSLKNKVEKGFRPKSSDQHFGLAVVFSFGLALGMRKIYCTLGLPHGDLTPENILFGQKGSLIKISDFGMAAVVAQAEERGAKHDIQQFGRLLWYLFTGRYKHPDSIMKGLGAETWIPDAFSELIRDALSNSRQDGNTFFSEAVDRIDAYFLDLNGVQMITPEEYHRTMQDRSLQMIAHALKEEKVVSQMVSTASEPVSAYINRGAALLDLGHLDPAFESFLTALRLLYLQRDGEEVRVVWANLERLLRQIPDVSRRREYFQKARTAWDEPHPEFWRIVKPPLPEGQDT